MLADWVVRAAGLARLSVAQTVLEVGFQRRASLPSSGGVQIRNIMKPAAPLTDSWSPRTWRDPWTTPSAPPATASVQVERCHRSTCRSVYPLTSPTTGAMLRFSLDYEFGRWVRRVIAKGRLSRLVLLQE